MGYERLYRSPRYYSELLLKIKTKEAGIVPLFYNHAQKYLYSVVQQMRMAKVPVRIIVVKARQVGISTGISSLVYHHTATRRLITSLVTSHDLDSSNNIYGMYRMFYDHTDPVLRPMTKYSNRKELLFENPNDVLRVKAPGLGSRILVDTSANTKVGRSFTLQNCHLSEVAYMENPEELMIGVEEAVPFLPGTSIFMESTANGMGDFFHKRCEMAAQGKGAYKLVFVPWFWEPGYSVPTNEVRVTRICDHDKDDYGNEKVLADSLGVTREQLQWRRNKIDNAFDGNVQKFFQEYPSTWQEAFIFSGQPMFPVRTLLAMKEQCPNPKYQADVVWNRERKFHKRVADKGSLSVWKEPVEGETYVIGVDIAEGIIGGDNSCVDVVDVRGSEQVAQWCGLMAPEDLAFVVYFLGKWYNDALVGPEINNHGLTTVVQLQKLHYWNLYRRIAFDKTTRVRKNVVGWKTTSVTKPLMIDGLRQAIREGDLLVNSVETIKEMLTYVKLDNGQLGAASGQKDDRVVALAIAVEMSKQAFVRSKIVASKARGLTMEEASRMADSLHEQQLKVPRMGSWRHPNG